MANLALVTAPDEGAAELIASALELRGIPFEIVPQVNMVYLGGPTRVSLEVRVPAERLDEARTALEQLEEESPGASALAADAGAPEASADPDGDPDHPGDPEAPSPRLPRLWLGVPVSFMVPFPIALIYTRHTRAGWLLVGTAATAVAWMVVARNPTAAMVFVALKAFDVVAAPLLVARANRAAGGRESMAVASVLTVLFAGAAAAGGVAWWRHQVMERLEAEATRLFKHAIIDANNGLEPAAPDGGKLQFPDIPLGRMYQRILEFRRTLTLHDAEIRRRFDEERNAWSRLGTAHQEANWQLEARTAANIALRAALDDEEKADTRFINFIDDNADHDDWTRQLAERVHLDRAGPEAAADKKIRAAMRQVVDTWSARSAFLASTPIGVIDERDRSQQQDLADKQRELYLRIDTMLRGRAE